MFKVDEISLDLGERIIRLYNLIDEAISSGHKELIENRQIEYEREENNIQKILHGARKNLKRDKNISTEAQSGYLNCRISKEEYSDMLQKMEAAGYDHTEKTRYISDLITAKYLLDLDYYTDDLTQMNQMIYAATRPCETFLRMFELQGFECAEQGQIVKQSFDHICELQKDIWHIVLNDRQGLYKKYQRKIKDYLYKKKHKNERQKIYEERGN